MNREASSGDWFVWEKGWDLGWDTVCEDIAATIAAMAAADDEAGWLKWGGVLSDAWGLASPPGGHKYWRDPMFALVFVVELLFGVEVLLVVLGVFELLTKIDIEFKKKNFNLSFLLLFVLLNCVFLNINLFSSNKSMRK